MIQNAAARLVFNEPKRAHVTPLFVSLHWLPVVARIQFKTLMLAYRTTTDSAPTYFYSLLRIYIPSRSPAYFHSLLQIYIPSRSPTYFHSLLRIYIPSRSPAYFHSLLRIYIPSRSPTYFHSLLRIYISSRNPSYFHSLLRIYIPSRSPTYFHSLLRIYISSRNPSYFHSLLRIYIPSRSPSYFHSLLRIYISSRSPSYFHSLLRMYISSRSPAYFHSLLRIYIPSRSPSYFHSLLRIYIPSRSLRSASERRLVVPSQRGRQDSLLADWLFLITLQNTLQNILFHRSWLVEWSPPPPPPPHPDCWIPVNLQATTENSSLSTLLDYIKKTKTKKLHLSLYLSLLPLLACTYLNNAWDLVLLALPLYVCLFKINRFMYSPIVSHFG